jgi:hypothetical protein
MEFKAVKKVRQYHNGQNPRSWENWNSKWLNPRKLKNLLKPTHSLAATLDLVSPHLCYKIILVQQIHAFHPLADGFFGHSLTKLGPAFVLL